MRVGFSLTASLCSLMLPPLANAYSPAGWVMQVKLRQAITIPAGARVTRLLETSGQIPGDAFVTLSTVDRAVIYATAGSSNTTCQIGLAGGAVTSPPVTIPANSTIPIFIEDTGPQDPGGAVILAGIVVTAGADGPITIQPGSTFTLTVTPTENAVY